MTGRQEDAGLDIGAHLWGIAWPLLAGFALGFIVLRTLRQRGLRWSWALAGAPLSYLAVFVEWHLGFLFAVATATASWHGARAHTETIQRGGSEAREQAEAPGPLRWALARLSARKGSERRLRGDRLALGSTRGGGVCQVPFGLDRGVHALVCGATGSGKTVTQAAILAAYVDAGFGAIVLDPKGDRTLRETAQRAALESNSRFIEWTPSGPAPYNPLARGGPTEVVDKCLAAHRFSEPHYELATRRLLGHALATMQAAGMWPPTLSGLVAHMDPERLDALASKVGGDTAERVGAYVDGLGERGKADLGGGRDRLAVLVESELGRWLDPSLGEGEEIDLALALRCGDVAYFDLDADRYPGAAKLLAAALLIDLVGLSADLQEMRGGGLVVIDEFAALAAEQVSRLFARARSACLSLLFGTQSLADLRGARPEDPSDTLTEQVLSNIEYAVVHRVGDPDSAERLARVAGTAPAWAVTERVSANGAVLAAGEGTRTRQRDFLIGPDRFKRLGVGEAVVIDPAARHPAQVVQIWPPQGQIRS